jgi:hypothetical protein
MLVFARFADVYKDVDGRHKTPPRTHCDDRFYGYGT